jgi:hypothetical protein
MKLKLNNVRLSYPALFEPKSGPEGGEPKYSAAFLMDKENGASEIKLIQDGILAVAKAQWGDTKCKWSVSKLGVLKADGKYAHVKTCLRDGAEKDGVIGYENVMFFSASNKMPVPVVDKNPAVVLTKADRRPLAGQYVNVSIRLWAQDNQFGRRVNAQLQAVQFAFDGETFGEAPVNAEEEFANVEDDAAKPSPTAPEATDIAPDEIPF